MGKKYPSTSSDDDRPSEPTEGSRKPADITGYGGATATAEHRHGYAIFVSHSWDYDQEYARFTQLLRDADDMDVRDYSVPKEDQFDPEDTDDLEQILREKQIKPASVVIVLAGLYSTHSEWIRKEIQMANQEGKPILGVEPWGSSRTSNYVERHADRMVKWNTDSIVDAIRELAT